MDGLPLSISKYLSLSLPVAVIAFFALIVNVVAMVTIRRRSRRHAQLFDVLLASLATADALFSLAAVILAPVTIAELTSGSSGSLILTELFSSLVEFSIFSSIVHVVTIAVERLAAVTFPLAHRVRVTRKFLFITVTAVWILTSVLEGSLAIYKYSLPEAQLASDVVTDRVVGIFAYVAGVALCAVHGRIIWQVNRHRNAMPHFISARGSHEQHVRYQSLVTVVSGAMLTGLFMVCIFPEATILVFQLQDSVNATTLVAFDCLLTANALVNPLVYFWRGYWTRRRVRQQTMARLQGATDDSCVSTTLRSSGFGSRTSVTSLTKFDSIAVPSVATTFKMRSNEWHGL